NVEKPIHAEIVTTDLVSGTYQSSLDVTLAEPVPVGLANYLWRATNFLHYDGTVLLSEDECSGLVGLGNVVNITGSRAEYATMNAIVQSVQCDLKSGRTSITLGP